MKIAKQHSILLTTYTLFLAGLILLYHLTLGVALAVAVIGFIVARIEVIERAGAAAKRRLGRLIVGTSFAALGTYLVLHGDFLAIAVLCLLGALCMLPASDTERVDA